MSLGQVTFGVADGSIQPFFRSIFHTPTIFPLFRAINQSQSYPCAARRLLFARKVVISNGAVSKGKKRHKCKFRPTRPTCPTRPTTHTHPTPPPGRAEARPSQNKRPSHEGWHECDQARFHLICLSWILVVRAAANSTRPFSCCRGNRSFPYP